jgi:hypothetical protein
MIGGKTSGLRGIKGCWQPNPPTAVIYTHKSIWLIGVVLPLLLSRTFPLYAILHTVIFISYIIGDLIAIPFRSVFSNTDTAGDDTGTENSINDKSAYFN